MQYKIKKHTYLLTVTSTTLQNDEKINTRLTWIMSDVISNIMYPRAHFTVILKSFEQLQIELDRINHHLKHDKLGPRATTAIFCFSNINRSNTGILPAKFDTKITLEWLPLVFFFLVKGANSAHSNSRNDTDYGEPKFWVRGPVERFFTYPKFGSVVRNELSKLHFSWLHPKYS